MNVDLVEESRSTGAAEGRTFVLVHGAWHGGWCWERVVAALEDGGHRAIAPTLSGLGEQACPSVAEIDLWTHIHDVVDLVTDRALERVVLVAHSYGGWVASGAVEQLSAVVEAVVFVDAFLPVDGESQLGAAPTHLRHKILDHLRAGAVAVPPPPAAAFDVNAADAAWVDSMMTPMPINTWLTALRLTGAVERVPVRAYVRATGHRTHVFDTALERARGRPGWQIHEIDSGHDVMIDAPDALVDVLLRVAGAL